MLAKCIRHIFPYPKLSNLFNFDKNQFFICKAIYLSHQRASLLYLQGFIPSLSFARLEPLPWLTNIPESLSRTSAHHMTPRSHPPKPFLSGLFCACLRGPSHLSVSKANFRFPYLSTSRRSASGRSITSELGAFSA